MNAFQPGLADPATIFFLAGPFEMREKGWFLCLILARRDPPRDVRRPVCAKRDGRSDHVPETLSLRIGNVGAAHNFAGCFKHVKSFLRRRHPSVSRKGYSDGPDLVRDDLLSVDNGTEKPRGGPVSHVIRRADGNLKPRSCQSKPAKRIIVGRHSKLQSRSQHLPHSDHQLPRVVRARPQALRDGIREPVPREELGQERRVIRAPPRGDLRPASAKVWPRIRHRRRMLRVPQHVGLKTAAVVVTREDHRCRQVH